MESTFLQYAAVRPCSADIATLMGSAVEVRTLTESNKLGIVRIV
jgi:hypothetical protein